MKRILSAFGIVAVLSLTSCATVFTGTKDNISFNSTPDNATVSINGVDKCQTPCTIPVSRSLGSTTVQLTKDGYQMKSFDLEKKFNAISIINLTDIIAWAIDLATGAVNKYDTKLYNVELKLQK